MKKTIKKLNGLGGFEAIFRMYSKMGRRQLQVELYRVEQLLISLANAGKVETQKYALLVASRKAIKEVL